MTATLKWRDGDTLGVQFDESADQVGSTMGIRLLSETCSD